MNSYVNTSRLVAERKKANFTLKYMSEKLGYSSPTTYLYIETGRTKADLEIVNKIAQILKKPVEYFFKINVQ